MKMEMKAVFSVTEKTLGKQEIEIVNLGGYVDTIAFFELRNILQRLLEQERLSVIVDADGLEYISSTSLGVIMSFWREFKDKGGCLKIARLPENIKRICDILGFSSKIEIFDSLEFALSSFSELD